MPGRRLRAAAPLRAHGFAMGALAVAGHRSGTFSAEDLWLLSTVTTHVAVVMANSRLFEMVRQAKEEWETAFNSLAEGIAVVDGTGRISRANRALARMLDAAAPTLIGRPFWADCGRGQRRSRRSPRRREPRGAAAHPPRSRSEALHRMLRLTAAPLSEPLDGTATVILVEDVTEQRALEAQLIQNEKLAAVGQLVSGVAHELNNPLTSIAGLSELLLERGDLPASDREHLRVVHEQAERAGRIVQNLLTFARKGTPEAAGVDLNEVVERTALLVAYELRLRGVELEQKLSRRRVSVVRGNRYELQQVLLNLLTNAVHAVSALHPDAPRRITVETRREGNQALLRVRDTGPGVPQPARLPALHAVLHHQGAGRGNRARALDQLRHRRITRRPAELRAGAGGGAEFTVSLSLRAYRRKTRRRTGCRARRPARGTARAAASWSWMRTGQSIDGGARCSAWLASGRRACEPERRRCALAQDRGVSTWCIADARATMNGEGVPRRSCWRARPDWRSRCWSSPSRPTAAPPELRRRGIDEWWSGRSRSAS